MLDRIHAFRRRLQEAVAERRVESTYGLGLFCDSIPIVYDVNYLRADRPAPAEELADEADRLMEPLLPPAGDHPSASGRSIARDFARLGWTQSTHLIMAHQR